MNTIQDHKKAELEKLLGHAGVSPSNRSMALEYLSADPCDDHLLEKAEAQDFKDTDTLQQCRAAHCLSALREAGSTAQIARYIKLYWAIGEKLSHLLLEDFCDPRVREQERELRIQLLGKRAVAAMEAEHGTWGTPVWLHQLAANEPEILEDARALGGTRRAISTPHWPASCFASGGKRSPTCRRSCRKVRTHCRNVKSHPDREQPKRSG